MPALLAGADGDGALEAYAQVLKPLHGLGGLVEEALVELVVGDKVMVDHRVGDGFLNGKGAAGLLGVLGAQGEEALGADEGAARDLALLKDDGVEAELLGLAGARHARAAGADDGDVALKLLGGLADLVEVPHAARLGDDLGLGGLGGKCACNGCGRACCGGAGDKVAAGHFHGSPLSFGCTNMCTELVVCRSASPFGSFVRHNCIMPSGPPVRQYFCRQPLFEGHNRLSETKS